MSSASTLTETTADPHAVLGQRNRDGALASPAAWNEVLDTILNHRSVRGFLPNALPQGTLETLIAAAQSASTSSNLQFWSVVAVEETERKSRLAELAGQQQFIRDAPLLLVWLAICRDWIASRRSIRRRWTGRTIWRNSSWAWWTPRWRRRAR